MIRITKLADYGIVLMTHFAASRPKIVRTARELSLATHVPLPTVSKILKALARNGLLVSHRGVGGGFALARPADQVSVADVITALDGPIAITECLTEENACGHEPVCSIRTNWDRINRVVRDALSDLKVSEMARLPFPVPSAPALVGAAAGNGSALEIGRVGAP
jgi:FeS assembly SUF system regulator